MFGQAGSTTITPSTVPENAGSASLEEPLPGPEAQHRRVTDFIREAPNASYTFDSARRDEPDAELCRGQPNGGKSCIKLALQSKALFKSMQTLGFYCALPANPEQTHMECRQIQR